MATAYELPRNTGSKTASDGAIKYTRVWRVVKSTRDEVFDVPAATGVDIGSLYPGSTNIYCTDISQAPDGDSLMAVIATANYSTPRGGSGSGGKPPTPDLSLAPILRPATITMSASAETIDAQQYILDPLAAAGTPAADRGLAVQPTGEIISGLKRPATSVTFTISQWEAVNPTLKAQSAGTVNDADVVIAGATFQKRSLYVESVAYSPKTETWQGTQYDGWQVTYSLKFRSNIQRVLVNIDSATGVATDDVMDDVDIGWDQAIPLRGLNCLNTMTTTYPVDQFAFSFIKDAEGIRFGDPWSPGDPTTKDRGAVRLFVNGLPKSAWWAGTLFDPQFPNGVTEFVAIEGKVVRAMVSSPTSEGGFSQSPCSQPIPLNPDGTPRARYDGINGAEPGDADYLYRGTIKSAQDAVLSYRRGIYDASDFSLLGVR